MTDSQHLRVRAAVAAVMAMIVVLTLTPVASAHEKSTAGPYTVFIGFLNEPALVDQPNAVDVLVRKGDTENSPPVTGLGDALKVDVKFGNQTTTLALTELDSNPGEYVGNFIPTAEGPYTFRVYGSINGTAVDHSVTSGPQTFSDVQSSATMEFPSQLPALGTISQTASSANDTANSAQTLGIIGIVLGALGLIAGIVGVLTARSARGTKLPAVSQSATKNESSTAER